MNKSKLRSKILKLRKNYPQKKKIDPIQILFYLKKIKFNYKILGGYYPTNKEIDDLEILNFFKKKNYNISLPVIKKNSQMDFYQWFNNNPLKINNYGIPEPISYEKIYPDVLLVPLVGFDNNLNRLGYGGGYYDRYIKKISRVKKIVKVGLAFSFQYLDRIPIDKHDKKLDVIITEKGIF